MNGKIKGINSNILPAVSRLGILFIIIIMGCIIDPSFLSLRNIGNNLANASILIILGVGETVAIITNGPDLSAGSIMTMGGVVTAILMKNYNVNFVLAILAGLLVGCLLGALNGYMIAYVKIPAFISTYGLQWAVFGFAYIILEGYVLYSFDEAFRFIGNGWILKYISMTTVCMLVIVVAGTLLLKKTTFGRKCYSIGSNATQEAMSGIDSKRVILKAFIFSGFMSAAAGVLYVARMNSVQSDIGSAYLLNVLAAVYMGGTSASGGEGGIPGTIIGALAMTMVSNCMNLLAVPSELRDAIIGVLIIFTVLLDTVVRKRMMSRKVG
ncbi:MAG TPA: ABC transporter permease [Candidatus Mediterraneibacter norfolkensis]|nr:ABC transporter permease [Candidatus Mediterraneibacter norfolkensis]